MHFIESDGRVYLNRNKDLYDLILFDAYRELGVPFHLLTREFYTLVKKRLAPGGVMAAQRHRQYEALPVDRGHLAGRVSAGRSLSRLEGRRRRAIDYRGWARRQPRHRGFDAAAPSPCRSSVSFRYPLSDLVGGRATDQSADGNEVLTDDFAPVNLYETIGKEPRKRK